MKDVVIVSACRTAIGSFGGTLRDTHATTIAKTTRRANHRRSIADSHFTLDEVTPKVLSLKAS